MAGTGGHVPVLLQEVLDYLRPASGQHFIDATVGGGGHSAAILERTAPDGTLLGLDKDPLALRTAGETLRPFGTRVVLQHTPFSKLHDCFHEQQLLPHVNGILLDLGLSSLELADVGRGFSFQSDGPLDMRFNPDQELTAADIVNYWDYESLKKILQEYGQERMAGPVATQIIASRRERKIKTVPQLVAVVLLAYRRKLHSEKEVPWVGGIHPATRTFQALRLAVNDELGELERVLPQALELLQPGGRVAVISFHSLEDRLVKVFFRAESRREQPRLKLLTKKPVVPTPEEVARNPRARSAKLRVAEKIR